MSRYGTATALPYDSSLTSVDKYALIGGTRKRTQKQCLHCDDFSKSAYIIRY